MLVNKPEGGSTQVGLGLLMLAGGIILTAVTSGDDSVMLWYGLMIAGFGSMISGAMASHRVSEVLWETSRFNPWEREELTDDQRLVLRTIVLTGEPANGYDLTSARRVGQVIEDIFGFDCPAKQVVDVAAIYTELPHDTLAELRVFGKRSSLDARRLVLKAVHAAARGIAHTDASIRAKIAQVEAQMDFSKSERDGVQRDVDVWLQDQRSAAEL